MSDLLAPFASPIALRAILACVLVAVAAALLGCVLLVRRLSLMGDAIGHAVLPGVGAAWLIAGAGAGGLLLGGIAAGVIAALAAGLAAKATRLKEDATFAAVFAVCSAAGVILVSRAGSQADLLHILFGNLLAIDRPALWTAAGTSVLVVTVFALAWRPIVIACFDPGFLRGGSRIGVASLVQASLLALVALTLLAALHVVGAVLSLGLLLLPAATAYLWCERWGSMLAVAVACGVTGAVAGIAIAWHLRLPPGPCVVCVLGALCFASMLLRQRDQGFGRRQRP